MPSRERVSNDRFGSVDTTNLPGQRTPALEYYQTENGDLRVEGADGPTGAWIEMGVA